MTIKRHGKKVLSRKTLKQTRGGFAVAESYYPSTIAASTSSTVAPGGTWKSRA